MFFFFNDTATTEIYTLSLHDALPIYASAAGVSAWARASRPWYERKARGVRPERPSSCDAPEEHHGELRLPGRSEEHTSELQSRQYLVCRLLLEKKKYI